MHIFGEKFVLPLCSGTVLLLMFTNPMHWGWTNRIIGIMGALALAGLAVLLIHRANNRQKLAPVTNPATLSQPVLANPITLSQPVSIRRKEGRIYIPEEVTLLSLQERFNDPKLTNLQAQRSVQPYLGKWVRYTGQIDDVTGHGVYLRSTSGNYPLGRVRACFGKEWREHLPILPRGKTVTVDGRLDEVDFLGAKLEECEFVDRPGQ